MSYEQESYEHAGCTIRIMQDDCDRDSPREWSNLGTILYKGRYRLGDVTVDEWGGAFYDHYGFEPESWADWIPFLRDVKGATVILPVFAYVHSGATVRVGQAVDSKNPFQCSWDSGQCGWIFDTAEGRETCGTPADRIEACLKSEVKVFDQWLTGEVYGYIIETEADDHADSCWGFYDLDDCKSEAESAAEWIAQKRIEEDAKVSRMMAL